jgi:hypothetical protein
MIMRVIYLLLRLHSRNRDYLHSLPLLLPRVIDLLLLEVLRKDLLPHLLLQGMVIFPCFFKLYFLYQFQPKKLVEQYLNLLLLQHLK